MNHSRLTIGLVRRGHSETGGAETYLKRLARGLSEAGNPVRLFTDAAWPTREWPWGAITRLRGETAHRFADELERIQPHQHCDLLLSLERVWSCDIYRAGDGIHRAWLRRRAAASKFPRQWFDLFNANHREILDLEKALFRGGARHVITNSQMVKREAEEFYQYPSAQIDVVPNGVPIANFQPDPEMRRLRRRSLGLNDQEVAVLFVGSGWQRKGLRFAMQAVKPLGKHFRLIVAGRGRSHLARGRHVIRLGPVRDLAPLYAAADIFLLPTLYDPFSNACLEALAAGLPVVTTRANGFCEIIDHGFHGSVVDTPCDVAEIRSALLFWSDPERRLEARRLIQQRAAHFDISANVERTLEVLYRSARAAA